MASIIVRNKHLYVVYYDRIKKSTRQKSLGLLNNKENLKLAKSAAKEFQNEISESYRKFATSGLRVITLEIAYEHFKRLNSDKHPNTKSEYDRFYNLFLQQYSKDTPCINVNKLETEKWLLDVKALKKKQNTKRNYYKVLKKFLNFLFEYNYCLPFKLNKEVAIPAEIRPIEIFNPNDAGIILNGLKNKNPNFKTMLLMLFFTGLRPSDIMNVLVEDIDLKNCTLKYYSIKTNEHFMIPLHPQVIEPLHKRIEEVKTGRLFAYESAKNMGKAFRRYLKQLKIPAKKYTLRTFRKSFISNAYKSGVDLAMVSKLWGTNR